MSPRGRRPAGSPDARAAIVRAARAAFAEQGYGASLRGVARAAQVDPALVHHYFPKRSELFVEAVLGFGQGRGLNPAIFEAVGGLAAEEQGEELVRVFVSQWDRVGGDLFAAVLRAALSNQVVAAGVRDLVIGAVLTPLVARVAPDRPRLRAQLVASQLVGLGVARWVSRLDAIQAAGPELLARSVGPTVQRYLTGSLTEAEAVDQQQGLAGEVGQE